MSDADDRVLRCVVCPQCRGALTYEKASYTCQACGGEYPVRSGVLDLSADAEYYFGEIGQGLMKEILRTPPGQSVTGKLRELAARGKVTDLLVEYATARSRCVADLLCSTRQDIRVLDLGCGWGAISTVFAEAGCDTFCADLTIERVQFLARRANENGLHNIICLHLGDQDPLPLRDGAFDIVILNGVLEWIPESRRGWPRQVQLTFLEDVRRILRPDGQVFVGIENRLGYGYILGRREDHTGLRWGALLARGVAGLYSMVIRGKPYRTYTYTAFGYRRLLAEAGFENYRLFGVKPNYRMPHTIASHGSSVGRRKFYGLDVKTSSRLKGTVKRFLGRTKLGEFLVPSFMIVASPRGNDTGCLEAFAEQHLGASVELEWIVQRTAGIVACCSAVGQQYIIRLARADHHEKWIERNWQCISLVGKSALGDLAALVPNPVARGDVLGRPATVETMLPGVIRERARTGQRGEAVHAEVRNFLRVLHTFGFSSETLETRHSTAVFVRKLSSQLALSLKSQDMKRKIQTVVHRVLSDNELDAFATGLVHGDFTPANVLWSTQNPSISGVIDWDSYSGCAPTFLDLLQWSMLTECAKGSASWLDAYKRRLELLPDLPPRLGDDQVDVRFGSFLSAHLIAGLWRLGLLERAGPESAPLMGKKLVDTMYQVVQSGKGEHC